MQLLNSVTKRKVISQKGTLNMQNKQLNWHNLLKLKQHVVYQSLVDQWLSHTWDLGSNPKMAGKTTITSVLSAYVLGLKCHARQWFARALATWREELKDWKHRNHVTSSIYYHLFCHAFAVGQSTEVLLFLSV